MGGGRWTLELLYNRQVTIDQVRETHLASHKQWTNRGHQNTYCRLSLFHNCTVNILWDSVRVHMLQSSNFACVLEETLKAVGPVYLISMPGAVKDPTIGQICQGHTEPMVLINNKQFSTFVVGCQNKK